jgi:hypothetical protein
VICFWQNSYPASEEEIAQALEGNWQEDQLFVLRQESTRHNSRRAFGVLGSALIHPMG